MLLLKTFGLFPKVSFLVGNMMVTGEFLKTHETFNELSGSGIPQSFDKIPVFSPFPYLAHTGTEKNEPVASPCQAVQRRK